MTNWDLQNENHGDFGWVKISLMYDPLYIHTVSNHGVPSNHNNDKNDNQSLFFSWAYSPIPETLDKPWFPDDSDVGDTVTVTALWFPSSVTNIDIIDFLRFIFTDEWKNEKIQPTEKLERVAGRVDKTVNRYEFRSGSVETELNRLKRMRKLPHDE